MEFQVDHQENKQGPSCWLHPFTGNLCIRPLKHSGEWPQRGSQKIEFLD